MEKFIIKTLKKSLLADTITPVSIYLKIRDVFPNSLLLESSDYHGSKGSQSYICMNPMAEFKVHKNIIFLSYPNNVNEEIPITYQTQVIEKLNEFIAQFEVIENDKIINGVFGYSSYDAITYFEDMVLNTPIYQEKDVPVIRYCVYQYMIAVNHFQNSVTLVENLFDGTEGNLDHIENLLYNRNIPSFPFKSEGVETSNITNDEYKKLVSKGKEHCRLGDVFQIVLSRQFSQHFKGDEFNVYRTLRSINPSPYLFYFDYGSYKIFGSSPEVQLEIRDQKAFIHPIAGTFKRTGNDEEDKKLAEALSLDKKENAEHIMLVDLARNDLSRNATDVKVDTYREIQYFSHVLHMVSVVSGKLPENFNPIQIMANTFPAGTLSGAPKFKAMQLIDSLEKNNRGFYGGCIGYIGFNKDFNQAIMIRSFLSRNNTLIYQAGAGVVVDSDEESELNEVNNKLAALKNAIVRANQL